MSDRPSPWYFIAGTVAASAAAIGGIVYLTSSRRRPASSSSSSTNQTTANNNTITSSTNSSSSPTVTSSVPSNVSSSQQSNSSTTAMQPISRRAYTESELMAVVGMWMIIIVISISFAQFITFTGSTDGTNNSNLIWALLCTSGGLVAGGEPQFVNRLGLNASRGTTKDDLPEEKNTINNYVSEKVINVPEKRNNETTPDKKEESIAAPALPPNNPSEGAKQSVEVTNIVKDIEILFEKQKFEDAFKLCKESNEKYPKSANILWRFARCHRELGNLCLESEKDKKKDFIMTGLNIAREAMAADDKNPAAHRVIYIIRILLFKTLKTLVNCTIYIY